eukprot:gene2961-4653_t
MTASTRAVLRAVGVGAAGFAVASTAKDASALSGDYPPKGLSHGVRQLPKWIQAGCGDKEYFCPEKNAVFPADFTPDQMPDLSGHSNFMAEALREHPEAYQKYKDVYTKNGVGLAKCIKTGVDNPGHPMIKTCGIVAGDEESYT